MVDGSKLFINIFLYNRFKISVEALPPIPDDYILIRSPMNKTSSVTFKLTNIERKSAQF